ncbi:MAG: nuclear transport factor 2 family protein [Brachymonas sp.]|nr:nuclear transport factor 2 family protein [Brachymonas sp.]
MDTTLAQRATGFLQMTAAGQVRAAYDRFVAEDFVHHNAWFKSDRASLLLAMEQSAEAEPNKAFAIKQVIAEGDRVAVYSHLQRMEAGKEYAVMHILRFDNGKIVEMWDMGQEIPPDSPNILGMF